MNRVEELTFRWIQGDLSEAEQTELDALLAEDEKARRCHVDLLRLEAALRGDGRPADVAESTVGHIKSVATADLEQSVMRAIAALPAPPWNQADPGISRARRWRRLAGVLSACLAVAAAVLLAVWLGHSPQREPAGSTEAIPAAEAVAVIMRMDAPVQVGAAPAFVGRQVQPGDTIATLEDGFAVLRYADGTRLELYGQTCVRLEQSREGAKRVRLDEGGLHADVKPQPEGRPLVVVTPHTELRILGTRFCVTTFAGEGTRVDLESGLVELLPGQSPPMTLEPGSITYVAQGEPAIAMKSSQPFRARPARETDFRGLKSVGFAADGRTVVAATNWQAVYWNPFDTLEAVPVSPENRRGREGIMIQSQAASMLAFTDRQQRRLVIWDSLTRKPMCVWKMPDGLGPIVALSPRGDWLAAWGLSDSAKTLRLWRAGQDQPVTLADQGKAISFASSPDGKLLAVGRRRLAVEVIEAATGQILAELPMKQKVPHALAFAADGNLLAVGLTGRIELWNVTRKELAATFEQPGLPLIQVALSPDNKRLAASSVDQRVWVWRVDSPNEPGLIQGWRRVQGLAFAPDGETLAVLCHEGRLSLWNLAE